MNRSKMVAFMAVAGAAALLTATGAQAHAKLASATPAANAMLTAAPKQIVLKFTERLQSKFSGFALSRSGAAVPVKTIVGKDGVTVVGTPAKPLAAGTYTVAWHAVTKDTHRIEGTYTFMVH